jgi:sugar lactone lactonase YvrE
VGIQNIKAELYHAMQGVLCEGPVWDQGRLYWTDIPSKMLYSKQDGSDSAPSFTLPFEVGAFALWNDLRIVLATAQGLQCFHTGTGTLEQWANPEALLPQNRFNDGKCDPRGRFVAGTINPAGQKVAALYVLDIDRSCRKIFGPVTCSNGLAWSADGETLYYIDTPTRVVRSFAYDPERGRVSHERVVIEIPPDHGKPDGMTIDTEGNLWIALWDGGAVECWNPKSGKRLVRIELPVAKVTSCVFGGNQHEVLFITTARSGLSDDELRKQDKAGSIFCARPGFAGRAAVRFGGAE